MESVTYRRGVLERHAALRYPQGMTTSPTSLNIYRLRIVLRGISPLIWRRVQVRSDTTLAHLHAILQILFTWSDKHLHSFHIHGKEYGSSGAPTCGVSHILGGSIVIGRASGGKDSSQCGMRTRAVDSRRRITSTPTQLKAMDSPRTSGKEPVR